MRNERTHISVDANCPRAVRRLVRQLKLHLQEVACQMFTSYIYMHVHTQAAAKKTYNKVHILYIHVRVSLAVRHKRHVTKLRYTPALGCCEFHHLTAVPVASCIHTSIEPRAGSRLGRTGITRKRTVNRYRNLTL